MADEEDTMVEVAILRDLSYAEWHAFVNGFHAGATWGRGNLDKRGEEAYYRGGELLGTASRYIGLLAVHRYITDND
jgi:hypothetical protein